MSEDTWQEYVTYIIFAFWGIIPFIFIIIKNIPKMPALSGDDLAKKNYLSQLGLYRQKDESPNPTLTPEERTGLLEIKKRNRWALSYFPWPFLSIATLGIIKNGSIAFAIILIYLGGCMVAVGRATFVRCPRCHVFFNRSGGKRGPSIPFFGLLESCGYCGLSLKFLDTYDKS